MLIHKKFPFLCFLLCFLLIAAILFSLTGCPAYIEAADATYEVLDSGMENSDTFSDTVNLENPSSSTNSVNPENISSNTGSADSENTSSNTNTVHSENTFSNTSTVNSETISDNSSNLISSENSSGDNSNLVSSETTANNNSNFTSSETTTNNNSNFTSSESSEDGSSDLADSASNASENSDTSSNESDYNDSDADAGIPLHVYFNFYDFSSENINQTIGLYSMEVTGTVIGSYIEAEINPWPGILDYQEVDGFPQVLINYGDVSGREINISEECHYDAETGFIQIPTSYSDEYLTVKCIMSDQSAAYQMFIPDEYKVTAGVPLKMRAPATDTSEFEVLEDSCNDITLIGDTSAYEKGDVITVSNAYIQTLNKNEDASLYAETGTSAYMGYKGESIGYAISFSCSADPLFDNIGNPGGTATGEFPISYGTYTSIQYSTRNWMYARCITTVNNAFDGNPKFSSGKITVTDKAEDGTLTCWVELYLTGPRNESAQNVGMYFKIHPISLQSLTITKYKFLSATRLSGAKFSLWSYDGTSYSKRLGYFTDNNNGTYTFADIDVNASVDQKFLIKEEVAPSGYLLPYNQTNTADKADYETYGGRQIQYTTDGWAGNITYFSVFYDKPIPKVDLTINKTIYQEDVYWSHGEPVFFFKISGSDVNGNAHTWHRCISFTEQYVNENTKADGTITQSTTLTDIPAGNYLITELPVSRFTLTNVTAQTDNVSVTIIKKLIKYEGITPVLAIVRANVSESDAEVTFFNRKITWEKYSHNDVIVSEFQLATT